MGETAPKGDRRGGLSRTGTWEYSPASAFIADRALVPIPPSKARGSSLFSAPLAAPRRPIRRLDRRRRSVTYPIPSGT